MSGSSSNTSGASQSFVTPSTASTIGNSFVNPQPGSSYSVPVNPSSTSSYSSTSTSSFNTPTFSASATTWATATLGNLEVKYAVQYDPEAKDFKTVTCSLRNLSNDYLEVLNGEMVNAIEEHQILGLAASSHGSSKMMKLLIKAAAGFLPTLASDFAEQSAFKALGISGGRIEDSAQKLMTKISTSPNDASPYAGHVVKRVASVIIRPKDTFEFHAVLPVDKEPKMRIIVKDLRTNEIKDMIK